MSNSIGDCCPLCQSTHTDHYFTDRQRHYQRCPVCALIFVPPRYHLPAAQERARYDTHRNSAADPGYREFLDRLMNPLLDWLQPGQQGLDFGCGPGPTLSLMLEEQGFPMAIYDPFYANDATALQRRYDFITCSEAIEHFAHPAAEWRRLLDLLKDDGVLAIMTGMYDHVDDFSDWYYKNDPTHVCFFARDTFAWLARRDRLRLRFVGESVALLQKCA